MTTLTWDSGSAYDFFISLFVLHYADEFGLRPSWTAGVRQRLSAGHREFLLHLFSFAGVPLDWVLALPAPKDAATALQAIADLSPADRLTALTLPSEVPPEVRQALNDIARRAAWSEAEFEFLRLHYRRRGASLSSAALTYLLRTWAEAEKSGATLLAALQEYQQVFFAEEEARLQTPLAAALERGRALAARLSLEALVEELSRGIHLADLETLEELVLAPSYWASPRVFLNRPRPGKLLLIYGARPEFESVAPGAEAPDSLVLALKALADPTRLRILRHLAGGPLPPAELARRLRLRPPTVVHHLRLLRLAGLVHVIINEQDEKRYATRQESLKGIYAALEDFLRRLE
ncbi:MAG: metalloregulator ArsR/SmtB family transcription factor [Anaerolineales bacterium]